MAEIYVNLDVLREAATRLNKVQSDQENVLKMIKNVIDEILSNWEGKAKEAFLAAWEAKKSTYEEFGVDLSIFSQYLTNYAMIMEDLDTLEDVYHP